MAGLAARKTRQLTLCSLMAAVLCALGPIAIPLGPIPVTLLGLGVYLSAYLLGGKGSAAAVLIYLLLGTMGLPVFAGYSAGLAGPTGGYLVGYLPAAALAGAVISRSSRRPVHLAGLVGGTAICYLLGTAWYAMQSGVSVGTALTVCVLPFLPFDGVKIALALWLGPILQTRLKAAKENRREA